MQSARRIAQGLGGRARTLSLSAHSAEIQARQPPVAIDLLDVHPVAATTSTSAVRPRRTTATMLSSASGPRAGVCGLHVRGADEEVHLVLLAHDHVLDEVLERFRARLLPG